MRLTWPLMVRRVHGHSMVPVLPPGTILWGITWYRLYKPGDVVVLQLEDREMVKRIERIENGRVFVLGDHADASTDSRQFGMIPKSMILARVIYPRTQRPQV